MAINIGEEPEPDEEFEPENNSDSEEELIDLPSNYNIDNLGEFKTNFINASESLNQYLKKTLFWSIRLMMETQGGHSFSKRVPGFQYAAYGFFNSSFYDNEFGVILYASYDLMNKQEDVDLLHTTVKVDGYNFPVFVKRVLTNLHNFKSNPYNGTGACYAESKVSSNKVGPGVLTAKHVVGNIIGTQVNLSCGCMGQVADVGPEGIDAAVLLSSCSQTLTPIIANQFIAPYMDVQFNGSSSGLINAKVISITDTRGIFNASFLPCRVFISLPGRPGDSGALITDQSGAAVGIYMGEFVDAAGQRGGIAQHAYQITETMDMNLYI